MMLILPVKILKNCGNSSILIFRIHRPHLSMYCSGFSSICVGISCGVDIFILRNLSKLNCVLCTPIRFCLKNAGPGSSALITNMKTSIGKAKTTIPMNDNTISINRLKKYLYISVEFHIQIKKSYSFYPQNSLYEKHPKSTAKAKKQRVPNSFSDIANIVSQAFDIATVCKVKTRKHLRS